MYKTGKIRMRFACRSRRPEEQAGKGKQMHELFLPVFEKQNAVTGFFSNAAGSCAHSPYYQETVLRTLGLERAALVWAKQVHEDHIAVIRNVTDESGRIFPADTEGRGYRESAVYEGKEIFGMRIADTDALVTDQPGILITTVHADCLPVALYDPVRQAIGVVHAGWRGSVKGIAVKTAETMQRQYGSRPEDLMVWIGPGISFCCFETGPEVREAFLERWPWADDCAERRNGSWYLDLKEINARQLRGAGIRRIEISPQCTCCEPGFCSYRKEHETKRRMGLGLCLRESAPQR